MTSANLVTVFEQVSEHYKERIAITAPGKQVRYGELNQQANRLAHHLLSDIGGETVQGTSRVALLMGHGTDMIAAMVGVLKAGMIYVPLDPSYPRERLEMILKDSRAEYLVTDEENMALAYELVYAAGADLSPIDIAELEAGPATGNPSAQIADHAEAYIMYTSGSTGTPKGVFQSHKNILNIIRCFSEEIDIDVNDRILLTTPFSHTVSAIDIFTALLNGAGLCLFNVRQDFDRHALLKWVGEQQVSIIHTVPTLFRYMLGKDVDRALLNTVRLVMLGGEEVLKSDVVLYRDHFTDDCVFVNLYGQSEVMIVAMQVLDKESALNFARVPVGSPLGIMQTKVVGEQQGGVQVLEEGELVIISEFITSGYVNAENPSRILVGAEGKRILYTGDVVRPLTDGTLEVTGRKDTMVKISGNRVDLCEIEANLNDNSGITRSVVLYLNQQLTAFYESASGKELDDNSLKMTLRRKLPDYMVPNRLFHIGRFPLMPNGKTDRQALAALSSSVSAAVGAELSLTETVLVDIWKDLFPDAVISIHDNFFQLGGNSLLATEMVNKVFLAFECELELHTIFDNQTIHELARQVESCRVVLN
jgi:amino acid adenylation domain-containing protein